MGNNCCVSRTDPIITTDIPKATLYQNFLKSQEKLYGQKSEINILSYNIIIRPPPVCTRDDDYKSERLEEFTNFMPQFDIICLQEMFLPYSSRREKLIEAAKKAGLGYSSGSPRPIFFSRYFCDGGLLTLSRHPIIASEFRGYPQGIGPDAIVEKGVLYVKIQINDSVLHLFSTHTQACYSIEPKYIGLLLRQFQSCRQFIDDMLEKHHYKKEDMVIALGDFNVDAKDPIHFKAEILIEAYPPLREYSNLVKEGSLDGYKALEAILSHDHKDDIQELLLNQLGEHPTTFGDFVVNADNEIVPTETQLTHALGFCSNRRLDYIFKLTPKKLINEHQNKQEILGDLTEKTKLKVKANSASVEKFVVKGHKFTQLSDHYGVKVALEDHLTQ